MMQGYLLFVGRGDGAFDRRFFPVAIDPACPPEDRQRAWEQGRSGVALLPSDRAYYLFRVNDSGPDGIRFVCFQHAPARLAPENPP